MISAWQRAWGAWSAFVKGIDTHPGSTAEAEIYQMDEAMLALKQLIERHEYVGESPWRTVAERALSSLRSYDAKLADHIAASISSSRP
jgi:hypothetical protein